MIDVKALKEMILGNKPVNTEKLEDEIRYRILQKRFNNLQSFIKIQKSKYALSDADSDELLKLWFLYDDLKEIHFIGTDMYSDVMFIKHKEPYLYRSVGKDCDNGQSEEKTIAIVAEAESPGKIIIEECLKQIKSGGNGKLYSYSKSFGKMLFKYANIISEKGKTSIEIREKAFVNCVCENKQCESMQRYFRKTCEEKFLNSEIPYFTVDMSNARGKSVDNMKRWFDDYLGEQKYVKRFNDIFDPIGDVEVVSNYTGVNPKPMMCERVSRHELNTDQFCKLLYGYGLRYCNKIGEETGKTNKIDRYKTYINKSIESIGDDENMFSKMFREFSCDQEESESNTTLYEKIDWKLERLYMKPQKAENNENIGSVERINTYKKATSEPVSSIWKSIIIEAMRDQYSFTDLSSLNNQGGNRNEIYY